MVRFRFTVRRMMLCVAGAALLLCLVLKVDWDPITAFGIGHTTVPLVFVVLDAESGKPIDVAIVRLEDRDSLSGPDPNPPYIVNLKTGPDGQAGFNYNGSVYSHSRFSGRWEWRVNYPSWEIKVEAEGYLEFATSFKSYANQRGGGGFQEGPLPPASPPIVIRLRGKTSHSGDTIPNSFQ